MMHARSNPKAPLLTLGMRILTGRPKLVNTDTLNSLEALPEKDILEETLKSKP